MITKMYWDDQSAVEDLAKTIKEFNNEELNCLLEDINDVIDFITIDNILVYKEDDQVIGFIHYGKSELTKNSYNINWLVVAEGFRDKGIGTNLIIATERKIKKSGGKNIYVEVSSNKKFNKVKKVLDLCLYELIYTYNNYYNKGNNKLVYYKKLEVRNGKKKSL